MRVETVTRTLAGVALGLATLIGCASSTEEGAPLAQVVEPGADDSSYERTDRRVAKGFVDALVQLPGYSPLETTLAFERRELANDPFLRALRAELASRGYGVRVSTTLGGENTVSHTAERGDDGELTRTLAFGDAQMRRRFAQTADRQWRPSSSLFIRGADASRVRIDESVVASAVDVTRAARIETPPATDPSALPTPRNVAELGTSNYAGVFENYANVAELILVFPNDSMVLGPANKQRIQDTVAAVDPERDLFSIIGCSFGKTALENGNEVLATGRANRVKEELLFAGVPSERVLDEGCWAGAPEENFPGRGVVLTVKRARS